MKKVKNKGHAIMKKAKYFASKEDFKSALECIKKVPENYTWNIKDLLFKARIILLGDKDDEYSISEVQNLLENALDLDKDNIEVLMELGYFYSCQMDDYKNAVYYFNKALMHAKDSYRLSLEGIKDAVNTSKLLVDEEKNKYIDSLLKKIDSLPGNIKLDEE